MSMEISEGKSLTFFASKGRSKLKNLALALKHLYPRLEMTIQIPISKRVGSHNGSEHWDKSQLFLKGEPEGIVAFFIVGGT